ncbi:MAG: transglutaminase-like domain-containing protein [Planctomycetota bacterium]|jgi:hypothetical protein
MKVPRSASFSPSVGRAWTFSGLWIWLVLVAHGGCGPGASPDPMAAPSPADAQAAAPGKTAPSDAAAGDETWFICCLEGAKVGYEHTVTTPTLQEGRRLVRVEGLTHMAIKRFGQRIEQDVRFTSLETPDGRLVEFQCEITQGPVPMRVVGRVAGDKLEMDTTTQGKTITSSIPWSDDYGGFRAIEQSLTREPMKPGEKRTIHALVPVFFAVTSNELIARDFETVKLPSGRFELLRIDSTMKLPDPGTPALKGTFWTDRSGELVKNRLEMMNVESYRATKAEALDETEPADFDLGVDVAVRVDRALSSPHETKRVRYRVTLDGGDPAALFVTGPSQHVRSIDPNTAEVTVHSLRPGDPRGNAKAVDDPPSDDDRKPNNMIQSDYPAVVAKAGELAGDEQDPWRVAVALERGVNNLMTLTGYSQAFATAAEVIESRSGDCTEHAVLLAALCRARDVPARVAVGLVYQRQAFYYHMWTEVCVDGRWTPLDATLARGGIGAAHLKLANSNLEGASAWSSMLPVLQAMRRLKVEIVEVE